jgi:hypothetical protein
MALKDAPVVEILSFDEEEAYNPERCISSLIRTQLLHLHQAEYIVVPPEFQTNVNINSIHTEREAGEHIEKLTGLLHRFGEASQSRSKAKKRSATKKKSTKSATKKKARAGKKAAQTKENKKSAKRRSRR